MVIISPSSACPCWPCWGSCVEKAASHERGAQSLCHGPSDGPFAIAAGTGQQAPTMLIIGLTGSIGMGKSVTARLFAEAGAPVHDADAAVHRLYEGGAVALIEAAFPGATAAGRVDRARLAARVLDDDSAIKRLEAIVHPLVRE